MNKKLSRILTWLGILCTIIFILYFFYKDTKYASFFYIANTLSWIGVIIIFWCNFFVTKLEKIDRNLYLVGICSITVHVICCHVIKWDDPILASMNYLGLLLIGMAIPDKKKKKNQSPSDYKQ